MNRDGVLIAGGGTAGHLIPGLAIANALVHRGWARDDVHFVGSVHGMESDLVPAGGFGLTVLSGRGLNGRRLTAANLRNALGILVACVRAVGLVRRARPRLVVSLGGYAALPASLAAVLWRVPLIVAEQNAVASMSNRLVGRWAKAASVPVSGTGLRREVITGNPVRPEVVKAAEMEQAEARRAMGWPSHGRVLLVFGGSLGSLRINQAMWGAVESLQGRVFVHHVVGHRDWAERPSLEPGMDAYRAVEYEDDLPMAMAGADLAVCRSGGSTVSELAVIGLPAVLVPLPHAPNDHQRANARALESAGGAVVVDDADFDSDRLIDEVGSMLGRDLPGQTVALRNIGHPDAGERVVDLIETYAKPNPGASL